MKRISLNTAAAIAVALCGFAWILMCATGLVRSLVGAEDAFAKVFLFTFISAMAIPGIFAVKFGFRLYRATTKRNIERAVGMLVVLGVFTALSLFPEKPNDHGLPPYLFLLTLIAIPLYAGLSCLLMNKAGLIPSRGEFIGRKIVLLVSYLIWDFGNALTEPYFPDTLIELESEFLELALLSGPLTAAVVFYVLSMKAIERRSKARVVPPPLAGELMPH